MFNIKRFLLLMVLLFTATQANATPSVSFWLFGMEISPICSIPDNLVNVLEFDITQYQNGGGFVCKEDATMNMVAEQQGSQSEAMLGISSLLNEVGYSSSYAESSLFGALWSLVTLWISRILLAAGLWRLVRILIELYHSDNKVKTIVDYKVRLFAMFSAVTFVNFGPVIINLVVVLGIFIANANNLNHLLTVIGNNPADDTVSQSEKFVLSANSAAQINVAMAENVSGNALFMYRSFSMLKNPGILGGSMTKEDAIKATIEHSRLKYKLEASRNMNVDATANVGDILNFYKQGQSYNALKEDDYDSDYREVFGYKTSYGTVAIGSNGTTIEAQSNESANDGTLMNQLRAIQNQAAETVGQKRAGYIELVRNQYLDAMNSSGFQSTDLKINTDIREEAKKSTKSIVEGNLVLADLGLKDPSSYDIVNGYAYANVFSGFRGHDMSENGDLIRAQQAYITKNIALKIRNAYCTDNWAAYQQDREWIEKFNAIPDETPMTDLMRKNMALSLGCGNLNAETLKIDILGFPDKETMNSDFKVALATKLAIDSVDASFYLGTKDALTEDKGHQAALDYSIMLKAKQGMIGMGLADIEISNYENAKRTKANALNSNLFFTYANASVQNDNYVMYQMLTGEDDIDLTDEAYNNINDAFPVLRPYFNNLSIATVANITPNSLTGAADTSKLFDINKILLSVLGQNGDAIKLMGKLPLDVSARDGSIACKAAPLTCEGNPSISFEAGMRLMGDEDIDYGYTIIGGAAAFDAIIAGKDMLGTVVDTVVTTGVGQSMAKLGPAIKFAYNTSVGLLMAFAYGGQLFFTTLKPVGYIMLGVGYFCKYFLPIMKVMVILGVLIPLSWSIIIVKFMVGPWYLLCAMLAKTEESAADYLFKLWNQLLKVAMTLPVFSFVYIVGSYMLSNFDPSWLIRSVMTLGDGGFMDQLVGGIITVVMLVMYSNAQLKQIKEKHSEIMEVFTETNNNYEDTPESELRRLSSNTQFMGLIRQTADGFSKKASDSLRQNGAGRNSDKNRGYREEFNDIPQQSGGKTKRTDA